tara:strand:- start:37 stop:333 length:297 start_codon:yes stop_codon:yes gene_type:complete
MLDNQEKVFTIKEIAHKLRVCVNTVRSMIRKGTLPAMKVGHQWRISETDLTAYLNQRRNSNRERASFKNAPRVKLMAGSNNTKQDIFGGDSDTDDLFA